MYSPRGCNSVCLSSNIRTSLALHIVHGQLHSLFGQHTHKDNHHWKIILNQRHICQWVILQADGVLRQRSDSPHSSFSWGSSTNQKYWYQSWAGFWCSLRSICKGLCQKGMHMVGESRLLGEINFCTNLSVIIRHYLKYFSNYHYQKMLHQILCNAILEFSWLLFLHFTNKQNSSLTSLIALEPLTKSPVKHVHHDLPSLPVGPA